MIPLCYSFYTNYSIAGDRSPFVTVGATDFGGGGASVSMVDAMVETGDAASTSSEYFIASSKVRTPLCLILDLWRPSSKE